MDRKQMNMLLTIHGPDKVDLSPNHREVQKKPQSVLNYVGLKGVDPFDQLALSYSIIRKSNKWLNMAVVNEYVGHRVMGTTLSQLNPLDRDDVVVSLTYMADKKNTT